MRPAVWSHADLVKMARTWLAKRCPVVITEMTSGAWEEPDAIGWRGAGSILVECKASRADLRADKNKPHRRRETISDGLSWPGLGDERFYLFPDGLVDAADDLIAPGWGVLYASAMGSVRMALKAWKRQGDHRSERALLVSCLRRLGIASTGGTSVKIYTIPNKQRATLTVTAPRELAVEEVGGAP
jgi:hypothetical protein